MDNHSDFDPQRPSARERMVALRRVLEGKQHVRRRLMDIRQSFYINNTRAFLEHLLG